MFRANENGNINGNKANLFVGNHSEEEQEFVPKKISTYRIIE